MFGVVHARQQLHRGLARALGVQAGCHELDRVHALQALDQLQDEDLAGGVPGGGVEAVGFEGGFDEGERLVLRLDLHPVLLRQLPVEQAQKRQPRLGVAQRVGPAQRPLGQLPVGKVVRVEGGEERLPVHVLEREHDRLDRQRPRVLLAHIVLVAEL